MAHFSDSEIRINSAQLKAMFGGISDMTWRRWVAVGVIPKPEKIQRRNYWRRRDLLEALRKHQADQKPGALTGAAAIAAKDAGAS